MLGLAAVAFVSAPSASAAPALDTVTATGSGLVTQPPPPFPGAQLTNINISARSSPGGQNASGTASFSNTFSGPVTCLSVTGSDQGGGTSASPTTAVLNFLQTNPPFAGSVITIQLVDNGGNGADTISISSPNAHASADCSPLLAANTEATLNNGRATVIDAPSAPTSKAQCKNGGWRDFPQFKNQGQCVAFVRRQARKGCLAERAKIGRVAFRDKYGKGPDHRDALRRCVTSAGG